jgi:hypothetical protein
VKTNPRNPRRPKISLISPVSAFTVEVICSVISRRVFHAK